MNQKDKERLAERLAAATWLVTLFVAMFSVSGGIAWAAGYQSPWAIGAVFGCGFVLSFLGKRS